MSLLSAVAEVNTPTDPSRVSVFFTDGLDGLAMRPSSWPQPDDNLFKSNPFGHFFVMPDCMFLDIIAPIPKEIDRASARYQPFCMVAIIHPVPKSANHG